MDREFLTGDELRELRRSYHDRIAALRADAQAVLDCAVNGSELATRAVVDQDRSVGADLANRAAGMTALVASVDRDAVDLLALQSPVARDLRIILSARDVAQISLLCVGLCRTVTGRVGTARAILSDDLCAVVTSSGRATTAALARSAAAWRALDAEAAADLVSEAEDIRQLNLRFFAALLELKDVPVEAALDLGMAARAYDRLTDHAVEVADRVIFAVRGS